MEKNRSYKESDLSVSVFQSVKDEGLIHNNVTGDSLLQNKALLLLHFTDNTSVLSSRIVNAGLLL